MNCGEQHRRRPPRTFGPLPPCRPPQVRPPTSSPKTRTLDHGSGPDPERFASGNVVSADDAIERHGGPVVRLRRPDARAADVEIVTAPRGRHWRHRRASELAPCSQCHSVPASALDQGGRPTSVAARRRSSARAWTREREEDATSPRGTSGSALSTWAGGSSTARLARSWPAADASVRTAMAYPCPGSLAGSPRARTARVRCRRWRG